MSIRRLIAAAVAVALVAWAAASPASAHEITVQGTVTAVDTSRVQVRPASPKAAAPAWYVVNGDTRVKRGTKTVAFARAAITAGERIVLIVDEHATPKNLVVEIRLAARDTPGDAAHR